MTEDCDTSEESGQELSISYEGAQETCPHCHGQAIDFLGNQSADKWVPGKSWFKCQADGTVFSARPAILPRYRYDGRQ
jgi:hypothetical protein